MSDSRFRPGDWVIYRKQKTSPAPGPRAQHMAPAAKGESYTYLIEKYWIVDSCLDNGRLRLRTRRGKIHEIPADDPRLRVPNWWQRWLLAGRFRAVEDSINDVDE